jgi:hypothetical protein
MTFKVDKKVIEIDYTDWFDKVTSEEEVVTEQESIIKALKAGERTGDLAIRTIVSREMGIAPKDIIRANKLLLYTGACADISAHAKAAKYEVRVENGNVYEIAELVGNVGKREEDLDEESYVLVTSGKALEWANIYLENTVPGHIRPRLLTIYENRGDVKEAGNKLKKSIDDMVNMICEPGS